MRIAVLGSGVTLGTRANKRRKSVANELGPPDTICPKCGAYIMSEGTEAWVKMKAENRELVALVARLRQDLADPPGDVQELVLRKLGYL